jgi:hypothetical protein
MGEEEMYDMKTGIWFSMALHKPRDALMRTPASTRRSPDCWFEFQFMDADGWQPVQEVECHERWNRSFKYFKNPMHGHFRVKEEEMDQLKGLEDQKEVKICLRFANIRPSQCTSHRTHEPCRDMMDGDMTTTIVLDPPTRDKLVKQIKKDSEFLADHKVMDYSLLLGVQQEQNLNQNHNMIHNIEKLKTDSGIAVNVTSSHYAYSQTYYMGIIDLLRDFDNAKVIENFNKRYLLCRGDRISAVRPKQYSEYFIDFLTNQVFPPMSEQHEKIAKKASSVGRLSQSRLGMDRESESKDESTISSVSKIMESGHDQ